MWGMRAHGGMGFERRLTNHGLSGNSRSKQQSRDSLKLVWCEQPTMRSSRIFLLNLFCPCLFPSKKDQRKKSLQRQGIPPEPTCCLRKFIVRRLKARRKKSKCCATTCFFSRFFACFVVLMSKRLVGCAISTGYYSYFCFGFWASS